MRGTKEEQDVEEEEEAPGSALLPSPLLVDGISVGKKQLSGPKLGLPTP